jgi:hypothetical protein
MEPTNRDLLDRMETLESKVDGILSKLDQVSGVWIFVKWVGSILIGIAVLYNSFHDWWFK